MQISPVITRRNTHETVQSNPENIHPLLWRIYRARGIRNIEEISTALTSLLPYDDMMGINEAAEIVTEQLKVNARILIVGDYDADGATSCALAMRALVAMGARQVGYLVPNRFEYGYGLTPEIVDLAKKENPDLIITVDNGIASIDGVAVARAAGIKVIITDHHLAGEVLPDANAIVNPNQPGCNFQDKHLAGVGVIFYLMLAVRAKLREQNWFHETNLPEPNMADFLDLVALGTVADVVRLTRNNRILVAQGLARIRAGKACSGILSLLDVAERDYKNVTAMDMGFFVAPRLNAAGRLDDMRTGIECLLAENMDHAKAIAVELDKLNRHRRSIEDTMREQAASQLENYLATTPDRLPNTLCLFDPEFHEGVIGILAGRIKDILHRPVIVFAESVDGLLKGSARSIPGLHIRDALDRVATSHPGLLAKFGGHAMAAGLTIERADYFNFRDAFEKIVEKLVTEDDLQKVLYSDGELAAEDLSLTTAELLRNAGPWGQGFPEPVFDGIYELVQRRVVGENHLKMVLRIVDTYIDAIAFRTTDEDWPEQVSRVRLVYRLDVNEFNGRKAPQLLVEHVEPVT